MSCHGMSRVEYEEITKNDGCPYKIVSKDLEQIEKDFPNLPEWHGEEFEELWHEVLPKTLVICFEYNGLKYKLRNNTGEPECHDGNFGAVYDVNNEKVMDVISSEDLETTLQSLKTDDPQLSDDILAKFSSYWEYSLVLHNNTELEYVVFKILVENGCLLCWFHDDEEEKGEDHKE